jgi:hypothetical protein
MLNLLRVIQIFRGAMKIESAWDMVALKRPREALELFSEGENKLPLLTIEQKIMKGVVFFRLREREKCIDLFSLVLKQLEEDAGILLDDKNYLLAYISVFIYTYKPFMSVPDMILKDYQLANVSSKYIKRFPFSVDR